MIREIDRFYGILRLLAKRILEDEIFGTMHRYYGDIKDNLEFV